MQKPSTKYVTNKK